MSLQIWMPLTKDLRQQGIADITVTNNGATYSSDGGKLGGCYSFDGTNLIQSVDNLNITGDASYSIAFWFYWDSDSWVNNYVGVVGFGTMSTSQGAFGCLHNGYPDLDYWNGRYKATNQLSVKTWYHLCFTKQAGTNGQAHIYVNGIEVSGSTSSSSITPNITAGKVIIGRLNDNSERYFKGKLNDVRIYDHCLSANEVKRIAQGLILHYPLNNNGCGNENLLLNTSTPATWSKALNDSNYAVKDCFQAVSPVPSLFSLNDLITISFDWSTTATSGNFHLECGKVTPWVWGTVVSAEGTRNSTSNYVDISSSNKSGHCKITFQITSNQTGAAETLRWFRIRHDGEGTANKTFTISNAKLERGNKETPWCPAPGDNEYSLTEYDISGFSNNGIKSASITYSSDSPKYSVSSVFDASLLTNIMIPPENYVLQGAEAMTYSIWAYKADWSTYNERIYSSTQNGGVCIEKTSNKEQLQWAVNIYTAADHSSYLYGTSGSGFPVYIYLSASLLSSGWHLFTWVYTTSGTKLYLDGELYNSQNTTTYGIHFNPVNMYIGAEAGNDAITDGYYFTGKLNDFRIYATALSADDVTELYKARRI